MNRAKAFLAQVEKLDTMIQNKEIEKEQWRSVALGITSRSDGERVQSSSNQQKMATAIEKYIDLEKEIDSQIDKLVDIKREIVAVIEQLNPTEYDILHKKYIQGLTFAEIAAECNNSYSWATTIHGRALKNVQRILKAKEGASDGE